MKSQSFCYSEEYPLRVLLLIWPAIYPQAIFNKQFLRPQFNQPRLLLLCACALLIKFAAQYTDLGTRQIKRVREL